MDQELALFQPHQYQEYTGHFLTFRGNFREAQIGQSSLVRQRLLCMYVLGCSSESGKTRMKN